ncbi:amidohydrolase [Calidifontibacter terrae]
MTGTEATKSLLELIADDVTLLEPDLIELRRQIHRMPELSFEEHQTTARIEKILREHGIAVRTFERTGLVAEVGPAQPEFRSALRADLDALPVPERSGLQYASLVAGACHACGHDVHTTAVLGAALALKRNEAALESAGIAVRLIFQPAEEVVPGGAHTVLEERALEGVDRIFAVHCDPSIDVGTVGLATGPITAACDAIHVNVTGRGGHTSRPHLTQDVVYALAKIVSDTPAVLSRRLDPRAGASLVWGQINAGNAANVIPATGEAHGTLRILDALAWEGVEAVVAPVIRQIAAPYGVQVDVRHVRGVPPVVNDGAAIDALAEASVRMVGRKSVVPTRQSMGGEDFSWMLRDIPGAMARLGTRTPGGATYELHQGDLVVDERAIGIAAKLLAGAALVRPQR